MQNVGKKAFWDFTWADIGRYDVKSVVNYVTDYTQSERLVYVGFSQGTLTMFYGLLTEQAFYESKVSVFISLAPCSLMTSPNFVTALTGHNLYQVVEGI